MQPRLAGQEALPPASWQARRDYSRFPVAQAIALPALADADAAARLEAAEPGAPLQIGFARELPDAYRGDLAATVRWTGLPGGGQAASFSVRSPGAASLRLAVQAALPAGALLRFFAADNPEERYPPFKPSDFAAKGAGAGLVSTDSPPRTRWSPQVLGDAVGVEIEIPPAVNPSEVSFRIVRASHVSRSPFADRSAIDQIEKAALSCEPVEVACKQVPSCPRGAVARITFTADDGDTYTCTGTALNSTRSSFDNFDSPYFLTANHCIDSQSVADSVVTRWHQEYETCGGTTLHPDYRLLQGGAELVTSDTDSDGALLRLRDALPNSACLAAWDARSDWQDGTDVISLHHPERDVKEWAGGQIDDYDWREGEEEEVVDIIAVSWSEGSTRVGSSGAGLFTSGEEGEQVLIGTLYGGPVNDCSVDVYGRFDRFFGNQAGVHLLPTEAPLPDDHGGTVDDATGVLFGSETAGRIDDGADADVFRVDILEPGTLTAYTSGSVDTVGRLKREDGSTLGFDDDGGHVRNFRIEAEVAAGTYYVKVTGYDYTATGSYRLHVEFTPAASAGKVLVPLFLAAASLESEGHQGFVRVFNRSGRGGEVRITATDDSGTSPGAVVLDIGEAETKPFNSEDLEGGNPKKGLSKGIGVGTGDWRLEFESDLNIEVAAYVRTEDGFLTSMHDLVVLEDRTGAHHVPLFNPASNTEQRSRLRLINMEPDRAVQVTITGYDDDGNSGEGDDMQSIVELMLPAGTARTLDSVQLEEGDGDLTGRLGDGTGKWRLFVEADGTILVVNLLDSPTGNLTNLSSPGGNNYSQ